MNGDDEQRVDATPHVVDVNDGRNGNRLAFTLGKLAYRDLDMEMFVRVAKNDFIVGEQQHFKPGNCIDPRSRLCRHRVLQTCLSSVIPAGLGQRFRRT